MAEPGLQFFEGPVLSELGVLRFAKRAPEAAGSPPGTELDHTLAGLGMHQTCPEGQAALHARDLGAAFLHWRALESSAATEWKRSQFHPCHP